MTTESPKVGASTPAVRSKPPTADDKKTTEKKEAVKRTPVKKDVPGLLALEFTFNLQCVTDVMEYEAICIWFLLRSIAVIGSQLKFLSATEKV